MSKILTISLRDDILDKIVLAMQQDGKNNKSEYVEFLITEGLSQRQLLRLKDDLDSNHVDK